MLIYFIIIIISLLFLAFSARFNFWRLPDKGIPVLMYHMVSREKPGSKINKLRVPPDKFAKQMQFLREKGYKSISSSDLINYFETGKINIDKPVLITFDDGYQDNYINAFPILKEFGCKAIFFIVTDFISEESLWNIEDKERLLNWEEIKEMIKEGMEFGSHTISHPLLVNYPREKLFNEIGFSKRNLEKVLNTEIKCFSYPFGKFDEETKKVVQKCDYKAAFSTKMGKVDLNSDIYSLSRILVRGDETLFDFYLQLTRGKNRL
ncbi:MAG: polysaccharide deacetylase family protein [bacterium]